MGHAIANPRAVSENETRKTTTATSRTCNSARWTPANGANTRNTSPCTAASVVPPSTLPSTMAVRGSVAPKWLLESPFLSCRRCRGFSRLLLTEQALVAHIPVSSQKATSRNRQQNQGHKDSVNGRGRRIERDHPAQ